MTELYFFGGGVLIFHNSLGEDWAPEKYMKYFNHLYFSYDKYIIVYN